MKVTWFLAVQEPALQAAIASALEDGAMLAVTQGNAANAAAVISQTQASHILGTAPAPTAAPPTASTPSP